MPAPSSEPLKNEPKLIIAKSPTTLLVPDLVYIKVEHLPGGVAPIGYLEFPPDAALEVLSPSQRFVELVEKVALYLQFGVPLVWAANPADKTIAAFYEAYLRP